MPIFFNSTYCSSTGPMVGWICGGTADTEGLNIHYAWITPTLSKVSCVSVELITSPCLPAPYSVCPSFVLIHWPNDDDLRCPQVPATNNSMTSIFAQKMRSLGHRAFIDLLWICQISDSLCVIHRPWAFASRYDWVLTTAQGSHQRLRDLEKPDWKTYLQALENFWGSQYFEGQNPRKRGNECFFWHLPIPGVGMMLQIWEKNCY